MPSEYLLVRNPTKGGDPLSALLLFDSHLVHNICLSNIPLASRF